MFVIAKFESLVKESKKIDQRPRHHISDNELSDFHIYKLSNDQIYSRTLGVYQSLLRGL